MAVKSISKCSACGYPLAAEFEGQIATCPNCGSINEAISQEITIPTTVFVGFLAFLGGMFLGPAIIASTSAGREWLEKQARESIRR